MQVNWDDAVKAHAAWKMKLLDYIRDPSKKLDPAVVGVDNRCPLGQWLHGDAKAKLGGVPEFETLVAEHARFHRAVGCAVEEVNAGKVLNDQAVLGWESEYAASSRSVVTAITTLKRKFPSM
jgi:methyl-accepting chemotaxis protein